MSGSPALQNRVAAWGRSRCGFRIGCFTHTIVLLLLLHGMAHAQRVYLANAAAPAAAIYAPGENVWAGQRLARRIQLWTGVEVPIHSTAVPSTPSTIIAIGTAKDNPLIRHITREDKRMKDLGPEGYLLRSAEWHGRRVIVAAGITTAGAGNATSELISWKISFRRGVASLAIPVNEVDKPRLKYRILWAWDGQANWAESVKEMHAIQFGTSGTTVVPYTEAGFLAHFGRAVDFASDHKLNGYILWGFLRDEHGGLNAARELSRYSKRQNVRILPGVCTEMAYAGFVFSTTDPHNLDVWTRLHPEQRCVDSKGQYVDGSICPSNPQAQQWLREGVRWLFRNLPDIGGVNLEHGDFGRCFTQDCVAQRAKPENDPNYFWDMQASQRPVIEEALKARPDAWVTFATYCGFTEQGVHGSAPDAPYPPRFLQKVPAGATIQWTLTPMDSETTWPETAVLPASTAKDSIGLLHHGSIWGLPADPARWWAKPGAMVDDFSTILPFICRRGVRAGLSGLVIKGQTGAASPANALNYVAFEYFTWHPERSYDQFTRDRLSWMYGGLGRARLFLRLLRNTTRERREIGRDMRLGSEMAAMADLTLPQRRQWNNLVDELDRRMSLLPK